MQLVTTLGRKFGGLNRQIKYSEFWSSYPVPLVSVTRRFSCLSKARFLLECEWDCHRAGKLAATIGHAVITDGNLIWASGSGCKVHHESAVRSIASVTQFPSAHEETFPQTLSCCCSLSDVEGGITKPHWLLVCFPFLGTPMKPKEVTSAHSPQKERRWSSIWN